MWVPGIWTHQRVKTTGRVGVLGGYLEKLGLWTRLHEPQMLGISLNLATPNSCFSCAAEIHLNPSLLQVLRAFQDAINKNNSLPPPRLLHGTLPWFISASRSSLHNFPDTRVSSGSTKILWSSGSHVHTPRRMRSMCVHDLKDMEMRCVGVYVIWACSSSCLT